MTIVKKDNYHYIFQYKRSEGEADDLIKKNAAAIGILKEIKEMQEISFGVELLLAAFKSSLQKIPRTTLRGSVLISKDKNVVFRKEVEKDIVLADKIIGILKSANIHNVFVPTKVCVNTKDFSPLKEEKKVVVEQKVSLLPEAKIHEMYRSDPGRFDELARDFTKFIASCLENKLNLEDLHYVNEYMLKEQTLTNPKKCFETCTPRFDNIGLTLDDNKLKAVIIDIESSDDHSIDQGNIPVEDFSCVFVFFPYHKDLILNEMTKLGISVCLEESKRYDLISRVSGKALEFR